MRARASIVFCLAALLLGAAPVHAQTAAPDPTGSIAPASPSSAPRPAALKPLYGSFIVLQGLDLESTLRALDDHTGREGNPVMGGIAQSPGAFVAVKASVATGIVVLSERIRKRHPSMAVLTMIGLNATYAAIVAHNYAISR